MIASIKRLGEICTVKRGSTITFKETKLGNIPVIAGGLKPAYFHNQSNRNGNVITISSSGASAGFINFYKEAIFASDCSTVETKNQMVNIHYIFHALKGLQQYIYSKLRSGAAQPHVYAKDIAELKIKIPCIDEQKRIAKLLDAANHVLKLRKESIIKLDKVAQSIFLNMFGDPIKNNKKWQKDNLNNLVNGKYGVKAGPFGSSLKKEFYVKSGYKIYGQEQVIKGNFNFGDYYIDQKRFEKLQSCEIKSGDILISLVGTFGKVVIVPDKIERGIINPRLVKITLNQKKLDSYFFKTFLQNNTVQQYLTSLSHGQTMGVLNAGILKKLEIIVPPVNLQKKFSEKLNLIISLQNNYFDKYSITKKLVKSIYHKSFRTN